MVSLNFWRESPFHLNHFTKDKGNKNNFFSSSFWLLLLLYFLFLTFSTWLSLQYTVQYHLPTPKPALEKTLCLAGSQSHIAACQQSTHEVILVCGCPLLLYSPHPPVLAGPKQNQREERGRGWRLHV